MNKEVISDRQGVYLIILFIFGSTLVIGTGGKAGVDIWVAILLAAIAAVPVLLMYARILSKYPGLCLYDILDEVFGRYFGKLFSLFFVWYSFHLGSLVLRNFGEFMNTVGLPETPKIVPIIIFSLICAIALKQGVESLARCSSYLILFVFFLLILLGFFTVSQMDPSNLLPIMGNGLRPVFQGAFAAFTFPFCETVVFMMVFDSLSSPKTIAKVFLKALAIGGVFVVFVAMRNLMVLGEETVKIVYFPSYTAISRVNIGNFLQRLEIAVTIVFILSGFVKISICLLAATKGVTKLFGFNDYRTFVIPVGLLMVNLAYIIYDNIMEMFKWAVDIYPYYAILFQVILPVVIFTAIEVKTRMQKKDKQTKEEARV